MTEYHIIRWAMTDRVIMCLDTNGDKLIDCINDEDIFKEDDEIYEVKYVGTIKEQGKYKIIKEGDER